MKLIIGLGNPGDKYKKTRHNIGFMFIYYLQSLGLTGEFKNEIKFKGEISNGNINGENTIILKPQTYMNLSGESVKKVIDFYKIDIKDIIVIYDDISMDFGKIRYREKGSAGGQNGIKDIIKHLGDNFKRIKVGIGINTNYDVSDWVLSKFTNNEIQDLEKNIFPNIKILLEKNFYIQ